jgi:hypothetical protein
VCLTRGTRQRFGRLEYAHIKKADGGHYRILDSRAKLFLCFIRPQDLAFDSLIEIMAATGIVVGIIGKTKVEIWSRLIYLFYALRDDTIKSIKRMGQHFIHSPLAIRVTDLSFRRESAPWVYLWRKDICGQGDLSKVLSTLVTDQVLQTIQ